MNAKALRSGRPLPPTAEPAIGDRLVLGRETWTITERRAASGSTATYFVLRSDTGRKAVVGPIAEVRA
jgi:hypothetical protein